MTKDPANSKRRRAVRESDTEISRPRLLGLLALLAVLGAIFPFAYSRLNRWREREELASRQMRGEAPVDAAAPAANAKELPAAQLDVPDTFADLPASRAEVTKFLKEEAIATAKKVVADFPTEFRPNGLLAITYNRFGDADEAEQCWQQCLTANSRYAEAYSGLAAIAKSRGDNEKAVQYYRKSLEIDPSLPNVRAELAETLMSLNRMPEAAELLEQERRTAPTSLEAAYQLGQAYSQLKEYDKAIKGYEAAIAIDPNYANAYYGLANVCRRAGKTAQAAEAMKKFKEFKETDIRAQRDQSRKFDDEGEVRKSAAFVHAVAGGIYAEAGRIRKADSHWQRAIAIRPNDTAARMQMVLFHQRHNRIADVIRVLEELRAIEPNDSGHCLNLAGAHLQLNDLRSAESDYRSALAIDPRSAVACASLAGIFLRTGENLAEARQMAQKALELEPTSQNCVLLAAICQRSGDLPGALEAIARARSLEPNNPNFRAIESQMQAALEKSRKP